MKKWKSIVSAFLAGIMILSSVVTVGAANVSFTDISSHWAKPQINYLVSKDVLNGYKQANGTYTFKPDGTVTRAEFIKMLDETFGLTATAPINYSDVKTSDWFHPYFSKAAAQGFLLNYGTSVSPNGQLTREEATTLLVRYLGLLDGAKAPSSQFTDYTEISSHFRDPVMAAVQAGLINGYKENNGTYTFRPKNTLTRAEALTILYRAAGAIYNKSAYAKDSGSADTNAVITKGGVTLSGMTLGGRVIITEGAAGETITLTGCNLTGTLEVRGASALTLDNCTVSDMTLDSVAPEITLSLVGGTSVSSLKLNTRADMTISSNCRVSDLIVNNDAKNVHVTGSGTLSKISVYASGFTSTMMPKEFNIASGLAANFASQSFTGSSADQASFANVPYLTEVNGQYVLNATPEDSGRLYYYFTDYNYLPTVTEYHSAYSSSNYRDTITVQSGKVYAEATFDSSLVERYDYVVLQLVSANRSYAPVIIDNAPSTGTGFSTDPYFDGRDISYTADVTGTVYYYYSSNGNAISVDQFKLGYKNADSAMKGSESITASRSGYITLNDRYLTNYPFVVVVLQDKNGQYYMPVVVSAGDNGFSKEPAITTLGTIEFKTSVSGTLYYYYAKTDDMPTPQQFANTWRTEHGRNSTTVYKNQNGSITYDRSKTSMYPYMVLCIKDSNDTYLTPFVLKIDYDTGFSVEPYVSGVDEIMFKAKQAGTVYWYFSRTNELPAMNDFMSAYAAAGSAKRGYESIRSLNTYTTIAFDSAYALQYPYIVLMLVDMDDNNHQPVLVDVKNTTATGFTVDPYCDLTKDSVYFKPSGNGTVYYYYTRSESAYNQTVEEFWEDYTRGISYYSGSMPVTAALDYISYDHIDTNNYPGIMIMFSDSNDRDYYPVYVSLTRDSSAGYSPTGITVQTVTSTSVKFTVDASGTLDYYFQGTLSNPNAVKQGRSRLVSPNTPVEIAHDGTYLKLVVRLAGYDSYEIDLTQAFDRNDTVTDGSTKTGYGYTNENITIEDGTLTFTATALVDGTITMSVTTMVGSSASQNVTVGSDISLSIPFNYNPDSYLGSYLVGYIHIQLTGSNGDVYQRREIQIGG